ncbi:MAG: SH3 domain-containing protein [Oscillospiraceae bacterium]|jgi:uncharacterized protein YgiM (DUF1202 family)|nr:SH3 domain-containing protein [Oscillospiraceae bacterium]
MSVNAIKKIIALVLVFGCVFALAACGDKDNDGPETKMTSKATATTAPPADTTPTTVLSIIRGTLPSNDEEIDWTENLLTNPLPKYVNISSDFLRVRKGPGTQYDQVAALTRGMQVVVVAKTGNDWFKLEDGGYYVSGEYLSETKPAD